MKSTKNEKLKEINITPAHGRSRGKTTAQYVQHLCYLPFGESFVDQRVTNYEGSRYTFSGKERDSETGYSYFGARYYSSDYSIWLSVDPLSDKYPSMSPYMYCGGNPVRLVDVDGRDWVDIYGNKIKDHSNIKVYIFYDPNSFSHQSTEMAQNVIDKYGAGSVALSNVTTASEFSNDWKSMASPTMEVVNLNYHGDNQTLVLNQSTKEFITSTGNGLTNENSYGAMNVQALPIPAGNISKAQLNINSCNSNNMEQYELKGSRLTLMRAFYRTFSFETVRGASVGVSYDRWTHEPEPQWFWQSWDYMGKIPETPKLSLDCSDAFYFKGGGHK